MGMDNYPCPAPTCKGGDVLAEADPNCLNCHGSGTVVRPKN